MYKVFVDNISIYFQKERFFKSNISSQFFPSLAINDFSKFKEELKKVSNKEMLVVSSPNPTQQLQEFFANFEWIEASGGIVQNTKTEKLLFIHRHGLWDIPKGKIEEGENPSEGAIREIEEECGIENLEIVGELSPTYHIYFGYGKHFIKKTHWFKLKTEEMDVFPQLEEEITEVKWFETDKLDEIRINTFTSILDVIDEYLEVDSNF